jgi:hypothetical protein
MKKVTKTDLKRIDKMIADMVIMYIHKDKKQTIKQAYKVDTSEKIKIGGENKDGFKLLVYPENTISNTVIKYTDCLYLLRGDQVKVDNTTILNLSI